MGKRPEMKISFVSRDRVKAAERKLKKVIAKNPELKKEVEERRKFVKEEKARRDAEYKSQRRGASRAAKEVD